MSLITRSYNFSPGTTIASAQVNTNETTLYNVINGNLDSTNINLTRGIGANYIVASGSGVTGTFQSGSYTFTPATTGGTAITLALVSGQTGDALKVVNSSSTLIGGIDANGSPILNHPGIPGGRLSLSSAAVMTADVANGTAIYYNLYQTPWAWLYDGTVWRQFSTSLGFTLTLNSGQHTSGNLYDVFMFNNSGTLTIAAGPAWSSGTARSAAITQSVGGLWTNNALITLTNNGSSYSGVSANQALYLGTFYANGNAECTMKFKPSGAAGGSANILGLYNAYNRIPTTSLESDSTASWNYTTASWRGADASGSNSVTFVDGLQQSFIDATYQVGVAFAAASGILRTGVNLDSTSATPNITGVAVEGSPTISGGRQVNLTRETFYPQLGLHYIQAMEEGDGTNANTFFANGQQALITVIQM